jgi:undecaprenyl phosphate N,N'-diacetylbacillosamine 1-phosphate transferase
MSLAGQNPTYASKNGEKHTAPGPAGLYPKVKSGVDVILALIGIVVLSPVFVLVALILTLNNRGTPFFVQKRPGQHGKPFNLIKFKTMTDARDDKGRYLPDEGRITSVGAVIRKLSLDEIPQLINIMKGEMSLIGPRPLLMEYLPLYNEFQSRRHNVKPGITGLSQVSGRNSLDWPTRFELDVYYVDNLSLGLDISILIRTVFKVITRDGITEDGHVSMSPFTGNHADTTSNKAEQPGKSVYK